VAFLLGGCGEEVRELLAPERLDRLLALAGSLDQAKLAARAAPQGAPGSRRRRRLR
jgi:hypothetical protein